MQTVFQEASKCDFQQAFSLEFKEWEKGDKKRYFHLREKKLKSDLYTNLYVFKQGQIVIGSMSTHDLFISGLNGKGISSVVISPKKRNQGFGKIMLNSMIESFSDFDFLMLHSSVGESFYEQFGFRTLFYCNGADSLYESLPLMVR